MKPDPVVIVGAGAAGLMAAGQAALAGAEVLVLEKMKRPGRKLAITGKGRCNLTNTAELDDFLDHFSRSGQFLRQAFAASFSSELVDFFTELGLPLVTERGGARVPGERSRSGRGSGIAAVAGCGGRVGALFGTGRAVGRK